ncbi:MAG: site-specific integrase [Planctomycetota bacterium]
MYLEEALDRYLLQLAADGRSGHTRRQCARHVRLLNRWLVEEGKANDIDKLDHEDIAAFLASDVVVHRSDGKPRKPASANGL